MERRETETTRRLEKNECCLADMLGEKKINRLLLLNRFILQTDLVSRSSVGWLMTAMAVCGFVFGNEEKVLATPFRLR